MTQEKNIFKDASVQRYDGGEDADRRRKIKRIRKRDDPLRILVVEYLRRRLLFPRLLRRNHVRSHFRPHVSQSRRPRNPPTQWLPKGEETIRFC